MKPGIKWLLLLSLILVMCKSEKPELESLDLLSQGLPLKIMAPADVQIVASDLGIMKEVTIKNEKGYSIQIFESSASQLDASVILEELKEDIRNSKFFTRIVSETESGFIFEKQVDENYINYDFRHAKVRGDKQYVIQAGLSNQYTLEQVEIMFESVQ